MLKVQEFIDCFDAIGEAAQYLRRNLQIDIKEYDLEDGLKKFGPFILLKPGHNADLSNPLVREANCLVLDENCEVLAKSWDHPRIVRNQDSFPEEFDFGRGTEAVEMPDGVTVVVYNVDGEWIIGTADHPTGDNYIADMDIPGFTFSHEIKSMLTNRYKSAWYSHLRNTNPMMCFIFNYVSPYLDRVMPILTSDLYLMSVINLENDIELSNTLVDNLAEKMDVSRPPWTEINSMTSLANRLGRMRTLSPGLMLRDLHDNRVIIPNPIYKAVANAKAAGSLVRPTHIASILQACRDKADITTIETSYQDFGPMLNLLYNVREELWKELATLWNSASHVKENMKDFAEMIRHHPLNYLLFMFKNGEIYNLKDEMVKIKPVKLTGLAKQKWQKEFESTARLLKFAGGNNDGVKESDPEEESNQEEEGCTPYCQEGD